MTDTFQQQSDGKSIKLADGEGLLAIVYRRQVHKGVAGKASAGEV